MRFEDERYVRLFTRDTVDWDMWPWEARVLLPLVIRKLDRAGILDLGKHGARGLAATIKVPVEVVEAGLSALLEDGCLEMRGAVLVMPNFLAAQECVQSDRARKRAERERARAGVMSAAIAPQLVTIRDDESRNVTIGHEMSRAVTDCHDVSLRAVPYRAVPYLKEGPLGEPGAVAPDVLEAEVEVVEAPPTSHGGATLEREVFEHWVAGWKRVVRGVRVPKLDDKRRGKIRARLREGFTVDDLKRAVDGLWLSTWHVENKRHDIELVCRDASHVDDFLLKAGEAIPVRPPVVEPEHGPPGIPPEGALELLMATLSEPPSALALFGPDPGSDIRLKRATPTPEPEPNR